MNTYKVNFVDKPAPTIVYAERFHMKEQVYFFVDEDGELEASFPTHAVTSVRKVPDKTW